MSTPPYLRLVPLEEEEEPVEVELEISPRDLAVMAASVCAALAAFWWLWKKFSTVPVKRPTAKNGRAKPRV